MLARVRRWTPRSPRTGPLFLEIVPGARLDADTVDTMWRLRTGIFPLKPEVDPDADRRSFGARVAEAQKALLLRDEAGVLRGTFVFHWRDAPDGRSLWLWPEYGYTDPGYRGHPAMGFGVLRGFVHALVAARGRPIWFAGIGYPRSHQSLERGFRDVWTLSDPDIPPGAYASLLALHETYAATTWDRATNRVWLPTRPRENRPEQPGSRWLRFEAECPDWADGYGLGIALRIDLGVLAKGFREVRQRRRR